MAAVLTDTQHLRWWQDYDAGGLCLLLYSRAKVLQIAAIGMMEAG